MRTKTLILTAALGAAGATSAMAQVYSVNAVGYINVSAVPGFILMANQLDNGDGNLVVDLVTGAPEGTRVYKFKPADGTYDILTFEFGSWTGPQDMTLNPGEGVYVNNITDSAFTITLVGEVPQGTLTTSLPQGFSIASSQVPQAGAIQTDLEFPAGEGDTVYVWDTPNQTYMTAGFEFGTWAPSEPMVEVGAAVFLNKGTAADWTRDFSVND